MRRARGALGVCWARCCRVNTRDVDVVFDGHRDAGKRQRLARCYTLVDVACLVDDICRRYTADPGLRLNGVVGRDAVECLPRDLLGCTDARGHIAGYLADAAVTHCSLWSGRGMG